MKRLSSSNGFSFGLNGTTQINHIKFKNDDKPSHSENTIRIIDIRNDIANGHFNNPISHFRCLK